MYRITTEDQTSTLLVKECTADDEGDYEVVVENDAGEVAHMFETLVNAEPPQLVHALPQTLEAEKHQPVQFKVNFDSPLKSQVTWSANGVSLEDSPKYKINTAANETTLTVADVIRDDTEMAYTCRIENSAGRVETTATLTIPSKASISRLVVLLCS